MKKAIVGYLNAIATADLRSLALFRIIIGTLAALELLNNLPDLATFYTDQGILPRTVVMENIEMGRIFAFHHMNGQLWFQVLLWAIGFASAVTLAVGYRTRLSTLLCWIFTLSIQERQPQVGYSVDVLYRMLLLYGIFLPLGARFSIDAILRPRRLLTQIFQSPAVLGLYLQIASVYIFSVYLKHTGPVWNEGLGVYFALSTELNATAFGEWLLSHYPWMKTMNNLTLIFESIVPLLIFIPWKKNGLRLLVFVDYAGFHLGMGFSLSVFYFQFIAIAGWTSTLPEQFWNFFKATPFASLENFLERKLEKFSIPTPQPLYGKTKSDAALATLVLVEALYWNIYTIAPDRIPLPSVYSIQANAFGIDQRWNMFTTPSETTGWFIFPAKLNDGSDIDLANGGAPLTWEKPARINEHFRDERWRKVYGTLLDDPQEFYRMNFGRFLCRHWNEEHPKPSQKLEAFKMIFRNRTILKNGLHSPYENKTLWQHQCDEGLLKKWQERGF